MMAPDGMGCVTQDAPSHHPWQHGFYFGLNNVNGIGFWTEGLLDGRQATDGRVHTVELAAVSGSSWFVRSSWRDPSGQELLHDRQDWSIVARDDHYWLDLEWKLEATVPLQFGKYAYGGPFLRMPYSAEADARLLTSEGHDTPPSAEGQRARWVAVAMRLPERQSLPDGQQHVCIALMDHPANPEHPVPWRVDRDFGVGPSRCAAGEWALEAGESVTFRHRLLVTIGTPDRGVTDASYRQFIAMENK